MPKGSVSTPFRVFERVVISLYDGGVLSPAVLERVIGAFVQAGTDWRSTTSARSVDNRSLHEIVVLTMLPGEAPKSALASFMAVVEHIAGESLPTRATSQTAGASADDARPARAKNRKQADTDEDNATEELLAQLSGSAQPDKRRRTKKRARRRVRIASIPS